MTGPKGRCSNQCLLRQQDDLCQTVMIAKFCAIYGVLQAHPNGFQMFRATLPSLL
jgi:hypothetical protein